MVKQNKATEAAPEKKRRPQVEPAVLEELTEKLRGLAPQSGGPTAAAGDGTIQTQASRLGDPRLQSAQQQALAADIGRLQGNQHLQRVMERVDGQQRPNSTGEGTGAKRPNQPSGEDIAVGKSGTTTGLSPTASTDRSVIQRITGFEETLPAWVLAETILASGGGGVAVGGGVAAAAILAGAIVGGAIGYGAWELEKWALHSGTKYEDVGEEAAIAKGGIAGIAERIAKAAAANVLDEDKQRQLEGGAITPLRTGIAMLGNPDFNAEAFAGNFAGLAGYIDAFQDQAPKGMQGNLISAANEVDVGWAVIKALALGPEKALPRVRSRFDEASSWAEGETNNVRQMAAQRRAAKARGERPTEEMQPEMPLTEAEANMLQSGVCAPLKTASKQLASKNPDLVAIMGRLAGVPMLLRSVRFKGPNGGAKNAKMANLAHSILKSLTVLNTLEGGEKLARATAKGSWQSALNKLQSLLKKPDEDESIVVPAAGGI